MARKVGFSEDNEAARPVPRSEQATSAEAPLRPGPGLVVFALILLAIVGMGLAVLLISLSRGSLPGIVFGMMFTVAATSIGVSAFIKSFRAGREAARNSDWRRDTRTRDEA
ncbi:hypothetical protein [Algicella marina]|uniref:Uncharacterized protein n=1 Tax=Algicella marina TaxID=2683284 RepID=A0A6P1T1V1_9RHOB|nr:hypothetical protein [Algicella marina]QHQ35633.1 hypothetical protein GO499_10810 [Algicella marina]